MQRNGEVRYAACINKNNSKYLNFVWNTAVKNFNGHISERKLTRSIFLVVQLKNSFKISTGCSLFIKYCVFSLNDVIFRNSASLPLVFDLPLCTNTDTTEGKPREARVRNIFQNPRKNTIFNEHPVVPMIL